MDKTQLNLKELEKASGGTAGNIPQPCPGVPTEFITKGTMTPAETSAILDEMWQLKVIQHCSKEEAVIALCTKARPVQRSELIALVNQYWDLLH